MNTTFHFLSANEISNIFLENIKKTYKNKSISIIIEDDFKIPDWQKEEVLNRKKYIKKNPSTLIDFDLAMKNLENES